MRNDADLSASEARALAGRLMRRQAALGLRVAAVFVLLLLGLPLANLFLPELTQTRVGGFTLTWLLLGVAFYPITCLLSVYFVRESDRIEAEQVRDLTSGEPIGAAEVAHPHREVGH